MIETNELFRNSITNRTLSNEKNSANTFSTSNLNALKSNLAYNKYTFTGDEVQSYQTPHINRYNGSEGTYLDYLNDVRGDDGLLGIVGTIFNGQAVGIDTDGSAITNFDLRNTIAGRVLSTTGVINDTPLGKIGNSELLKMVGNNTLLNLQTETIGRVNLDPFNAIKGGSIIRPNYSITIGYDTLGKVSKTIEDVTGFNIPISRLSSDSEIWTSGNNQNLIKNTGQGQIQALFANLSTNKYGPGYEDSRIKNISVSDQLTYGDTMKNSFGLHSGADDYDELSPSKNSLLGKTKELLGDSSNQWYKGKQQIQPRSFTTNTVSVGGLDFMSRGSGVKSAEGLNGDIDNVFGRVFTKKDTYSKVKNLQKHRGIDYKDYSSDSVLDSNGFVRVSPYTGDGTGVNGEFNNMKKFMLSIENLAWDGDTDSLPTSEIGPGDPVNKTRGRIMWFPPYDISFTDSTSVNWESTNFIGRGEPIYSYNNTERSGFLQFKLIIDYPSYIEDMKNSSSDLFNSIASGTKEFELKNLSSNEISSLELFLKMNSYAYMDAGSEKEPEPMTFYFDKDISEYTSPSLLLDAVDKIASDCPSCKVIIKGYTSMDEDRTIAQNRATDIKSFLQTELELKETENLVILASGSMGHIGCSGENIALDADCRQKARRVDITFEYVPTKNEENVNNEKSMVDSIYQSNTSNVTLSNEIKKRFMNESMYFQKLSEDDPIAYDSITDKIKYFHPGFHSMTPEGFNSRLNFLQQCTRQGATQNTNKADNLAFGKPPVCILRVGDFYHTKIVMETLNFAYEPLVWDLNPEGVGVQPMICTVDIGFKFIGGSSLNGPINKLQNALSNNFFANTEIYDPRADSIVDGKYESSDISTKDKPFTQPEVKEGGVIKDEIKVDEVERTQIETDPKLDTKKDLIGNLKVEVVGNSEDDIRFIITKKDGYTTPINGSIKLRPMITIFDEVLSESDGYEGLMETKYPPIVFDEAKVGSEIIVGFTDYQKEFIYDSNKIVLNLENDGLKINGEEYTI